MHPTPGRIRCSQSLKYETPSRFTGGRIPRPVEATGKTAYLREVVARLDELLTSEGVWSNKEWDGDLGVVFLRGYDATGRPEFLEAGAATAWRLAVDCQLGLCQLNPGLSAAACMAQAYRTIGGSYLLRIARSILARTQSYQHPDGSFPHQLDTDSRNLPYSSWKAFQLWTYLKLDPEVRTAYATGIDHNGKTVQLDFDSMMSLLLSFLKRQVNVDGTISYSGGWKSDILLDPECRYCSSTSTPCARRTARNDAALLRVAPRPTVRRRAETRAGA
jgi:hypothetical protein